MVSSVREMPEVKITHRPDIFLLASIALLDIYILNLMIMCLHTFKMMANSCNLNIIFLSFPWVWSMDVKALEQDGAQVSQILIQEKYQSISSKNLKPMNLFHN